MHSSTMPGEGAWRAVRWILPPGPGGRELLFLYAAAPSEVLDMDALAQRLSALGICRLARPAVGPLLACWRFIPPEGADAEWSRRALRLAFQALGQSCSDPSLAVGPERFASDAQFRAALPALAERELLSRSCPERSGSEGRDGRGRL